MSTPLQQIARVWMAQDPDPQTRALTARMLQEPTTLQDHFGARLAFGTAGMRGPLGPGPNRMNRALVRRVSTALATTVIAHQGLTRPVVVGFDGRTGSEAFAHDTAAILGARGLPVLLYDRVCPTPELAHAVRHFQAAAGVMITASHNPATDNGYKVYWHDGVQIVPPVDRWISEAIPSTLDGVCRPDLASLRATGAVRSVPVEARDAYLEQILALRVHPGADQVGLRIVYTAMHGVGTDLVRRALTAAGHHDLHEVNEQAEPHPDFPTVAFPNPEEPGALDLAIALAEHVDADLILANDPDADRLAVAVPDPAGGWRRLSGNQIGVLLCDDLLCHGPRSDHRMVATTIVSTSMAARIAAQHRVTYAETLTGFKWIAQAAVPFVRGSGRFVIGFEEAIGFSIGSVVRDKDGVSAALIFADLAAALKAQGDSVLDALEALYQRHGLHLSAQTSIQLPGLDGAERIAAILRSLRNEPLTHIGDSAVRVHRDLLHGIQRDLGTGHESSTGLPRSDVLAWDLDDGSRVLARPSGTEPKIKFYFEVCQPIPSGDSVASWQPRATTRLAALRDAFVNHVSASMARTPARRKPSLG